MISYKEKSSNPKHQGTEKYLNFESVEWHYDIIKIEPTEAVK